MKALLCSLAFLLSGCVLIDGTPPRQDVVPFERGAGESRPFRRVALVPLQAAEGDAAAAALLRDALQRQITTRSLFEAVPVPGDDLVDLHLERARRDGVVASEDLIAAGRRFGVDGVLTGTITHARTAPAVLLGARLTLIDTRTGRVAWTTDVVLDATDARVAADVHNYYDSVYEDPSRSLLEHEKVLISPRLFSDYAASRIADTLAAALGRSGSAPAVADR